MQKRVKWEQGLQFIAGTPTYSSPKREQRDRDKRKDFVWTLPRNNSFIQLQNYCNSPHDGNNWAKHL